MPKTHESPVLTLVGSTWYADGGGGDMWLCDRVLRRFWTLPRGTTRIRLVACDHYVRGAQKVDSPDMPASVTGVYEGRQRTRLTSYGVLSRFLRAARSRFGSGQDRVWGWIEIEPEED